MLNVRDRFAEEAEAAKTPAPAVDDTAAAVASPLPPAAAPTAATPPVAPAAEVFSPPVVAETKPHLVLPAPTLAEQLRTLRVEAGLTMDEVAEKIRCTREVLEALEIADYAAITMRPHYLRATVARLCALFEIEPEALLERLKSECPASGDDGDDDVGQSGSLRMDPTEEGGADGESRLQRLSTVLIVALLVLLAGLLLSAWVVQHFRKSRDAVIRIEIENVLPDLIVPERAPLEVLPVPLD